jgi:hypothetical protein
MKTCEGAEVLVRIFATSPLPLYYPLNRWLSQDDMETVPGLELRTLGHPTRSKSLYRLRYSYLGLKFALNLTGCRPKMCRLCQNVPTSQSRAFASCCVCEIGWWGFFIPSTQLHYRGLSLLPILLETCSSCTIIFRNKCIIS